MYNHISGFSEISLIIILVFYRTEVKCFLIHPTDKKDHHFIMPISTFCHYDIFESILH